MKSYIFVATWCLISILSSQALSQDNDINKLEDASTIPADLYEKFTVNDIAKSLINRFHQIKEKSIKGDFNYKKSSTIFLAFNSGHLKSILESKEIFNGHQTKQGPTFNDDLRFRAQLEDELIGLRLEAQNRLRPKYAYLVNEHYPYYPKTTFNPNYGNIVVKIKDRLKERTTFTIGDSMEEGRNTLHTFNFKGKIEIVQPFEKIAYWEAQIWGSLQLDDIDYFLVNCNGFPRISLTDIKALINARADVRFCNLAPSMQEISAGKKVHKSDMTTANFLENDDKEKPVIQNMKISQVKGKTNISFDVSDNLGINFCQTKVIKNGVLVFDDETSNKQLTIKNLVCTFQTKEVTYPFDLQIYAKDWYGNQTTKSVKVLK